MVSFEEFKIIYNAMHGEPEFEFYFKDSRTTYMLIKYKNKVSFQRCGTYEEQSGEFYYSSLDDLYVTRTVDDICLKDMWGDIEAIVAEAFYDLSKEEDLAELKYVYSLEF